MSTPRSFDYAVVDVFAEQALAGNPLAVIADARGLTTAEMQAIARETNLSETTFLLPRDPEIEQRDGVKVRIFTVKEELRFAGHPTLGTASWLWMTHPILRNAEEITLELPVGPITVRFKPEPGRFGIFSTMRQQDPSFGALHKPAAVAGALGLTADDLDPAMPIQTVSTGMPFCIVPLRSLDVAVRLNIVAAQARQYLAGTDAKFFYCITRAAQESGAQWHARMQFYNGEDPATGSAAGCAISYLVRHGFVASGETVLLEQGVEMLRPSLLHLSAVRSGDEVSEVRVGGRTILVATGRLFIP